jgi:beta-lactamase regulating signal transducer with metallopeptidase domain
MLVAIVLAVLRATLLLTLACLAATTLRRSSAAARHLVWAATLTGLLALPLFALLVPSVPVTMPRAVDVTPVAVPAPTADWSWILWTVWACGAAVVIARLAVGLTRVRLIATRAATATSPRWEHLLATAAARVGVRRAVALRIGSPGTVPVTCGTIHPMIILPPDAESWADERVTLVLTHELAHVRRLDVLTHITGQLALAAFWFHPLTWLATARLRRERERACDDLVIATGARPSRYAHDLLTLVDTLRATPAPAAAALAMARRTEIEGRLVAILDASTRRTPVGPRRLIASLGVAAGTVLLLAALRPVAAAVTTTAAVAIISLPPVQAIAKHLSPAATLANAATDASTLPSDAAKRAALLAIVPHYCGNDTLRRAFFAATNTITSAAERERVLTALRHHVNASSHAVSHAVK